MDGMCTRLCSSPTPSTHTYTLATLSSWFLLPSLLAAYHHHWAHAALLTAVSTVSYLHWNQYQPGSWRQRLDKLLATTTIVTHVLWGGVYTHPLPDIPVQSALALLALWYTTACHYPVGSWEGLWSHLMFRYFGLVGTMEYYVEWAVGGWEWVGLAGVFWGSGWMAVNKWGQMGRSKGV